MQKKSVKKYYSAKKSKKIRRILRKIRKKRKEKPYKYEASYMQIPNLGHRSSWGKKRKKKRGWIFQSETLEYKDRDTEEQGTLRRHRGRAVPAPSLHKGQPGIQESQVGGEEGRRRSRARGCFRKTLICVPCFFLSQEIGRVEQRAGEHQR